MEKRIEHDLSIHSRVLRKTKENSLPFPFPTPFNFVYHVNKDSMPMPSAHKSISVSPYAHLVKTQWMDMSSKLWTVARCTSSHSTRELTSTGASSMDQEDGYGEDFDNNLPGMQGRRHNMKKATRNSSANDMQVNHMIGQETGLQRLHAMYALGPDWMFVQEDTRILTTMFYRSVLLGFLINIVKVAQTESKSRKNMSPSQAVMKMGTGMNSMADSTRILKEAAKGSLRLTGFAASLLYLSQSIAAYRNQSSEWEYSISTAVAMAFAGYGKPPKSFAVTVLGGAVVGALGGSLVCSILSSTGGSQEQRTLNRIRQKLAQEHELQAEGDMR